MLNDYIEGTLWYSNMAPGNPLWMEVLIGPFSIAMFDYWRVDHIFLTFLNHPTSRCVAAIRASQSKTCDFRCLKTWKARNFSGWCLSWSTLVEINVYNMSSIFLRMIVVPNFEKIAQTNLKFTLVGWTSAVLRKSFAILIKSSTPMINSQGVNKNLGLTWMSDEQHQWIRGHSQRFPPRQLRSFPTFRITTNRPCDMGD